VNCKGLERQADLRLRRRKQKKAMLGERQPLLQPESDNQV